MFPYVLDKYRNVAMPEIQREKFNDTIDLSLGDPDFNTDLQVIEKTFEDVKNGATHYTAPSGMKELKEVIKDYMYEEYSQSLDLNEIFVTSNGTHSMYLALKACIEKDDEVILFEPFFLSYKLQVEACEGKVKYVTLKLEEGFQINEEELIKAITPKTKALIFNNPCNPTGVCFNEESYQIICRVAKKYNLLVLADDIYTIYCFGDKFRPISTYEGMKDHVISIRSFSKNYAMTGWRLGAIIAPKEVIDAVNFINFSVAYSPSTISQRAGIHAIKERKRYQDDFINIFKERMELTYNIAKDIPYMKVVEPKGAFYMFINIEDTGMTGDEFVDYIYEKCHIVAISGKNFGPSFTKYIRICFTVSKEDLIEAFSRLSKLKF